MNQQPFSNTSLAGFLQYNRNSGNRLGKQGLQNADPLGIAGLQEISQEVKRHKVTTDALFSLSDQFAHQVAIFPKTDEVTITKDGVYIPQNVLGKNVEIKHEEHHLTDGSVHITILSYPRERTAKIRHVKTIDCTLELSWLDEHRDEYIGQWVALKEKRLLSYGTNAREVYEAARKAGVESPVLIQVEPKNDLPFGGW